MTPTAAHTLSPAELDKLRADFEAEAPNFSITVERFKQRPDDYKFEHTSSMWKFVQAVAGRAQARAALTGQATAPAQAAPSEQDERVLFDKADIRDVFGAQPSYRERELMFAAFKVGRAAQGASGAPTEPESEMLDMLGRVHPYAMPMADFHRAEERLERAVNLQQPWPVPDQAAIVWRGDLMNLMAELQHKRSVFDDWKRMRAAPSGASGAQGEPTGATGCGGMGRWGDMPCLGCDACPAFQATGAAGGEELPPMPSNVAHVTRRIRRCESDAPAQVVLEHFAMEYARQARAAASQAAPGVGADDFAVRFIEQRAEQYLQDNSSTEHDTGAVVFHYGRIGEDYYNSLVELVEDIRAVRPALPAPAQPAEQRRALDAALRGEVSMMYMMLDEGEWAEHVAVTPEGQCLETAITKLIGKAAPAQPAGAANIEVPMPPAGRRVTYVPLRGKKGVIEVTAWGPFDMVLPAHRRIIADVPLYDHAPVVRADVPDILRIRDEAGRVYQTLANLTDQAAVHFAHALTASPSPSAPQGTPQEQFEEALTNVLCEHTKLNDDGLDEWVCRIIGYLPRAVLPFDVVPSEGTDPAHYGAPQGQEAAPAAKVIINDGKGTATIMLAPEARLLIGSSLYAAPVAGEAPAGAQWSKEPPTEQADYWNWNGDPDHAPMIYHVLWSGTAKKCFVSIGQYDITNAIFCDTFGGWWLKIEQPAIPSGHDSANGGERSGK